MFAANQSAAPNGGLFIEDVFLVNTRSGTGATATVTGGPDMSTKGGLHIAKARSTTTGWRFTDTLRGATFSLDSSSTAAQVTESSGLTAFTTSGATIGADADYNASGQTFADFFFRRAPKFFDVVTYTGNGVAGRTVAHSLGQAPGMIVVKRTDAASDWPVYSLGMGNAGNYMLLNTTAAQVSSSVMWAANPTASVFSVGADPATNANGGTYTAYLFAHDTSTDGLIQCGSFTTDASGNATVTVPWTVGAQYAMIKCSSTTGDWEIYDNVRTAGFTGNDARLRANLSNAEDAVTRISASGTSVMFSGLSASATYVYKIIRARKP